MKKLTVREQAFVAAFTGSQAGNATAAAVEAGYTKNRRAAAVQATRLLTRANVQAALKVRMERREQVVRETQNREAISDARIDSIITEIFEDAKEDTFARLRAGDMLNKTRARYALKLIHSGRLTIEQALDRANAKLEERKAKQAALPAGKQKQLGAGK